MLQLSFVNFKQGSYITVEGKTDTNRFFIIQVGKVRCFRQDNKNTPDVLGPGDFIGVISCMSGNAQIENSVAMTDVVCIAVRKDQYSDLIQQNTPVAMKIIRTFAARMRTMNETLMSLTSNASIGMVKSAAGSGKIFQDAVYYDRKKLYSQAYFCYFQFLRNGAVGSSANIAKQRMVMLRGKVKAPYVTSNADLLRSYPKDSMIMCENQSGNEMFIIQEGHVRITKIINGEEVTLALLKKGDMFGEMALLENKPRSAAAIAHEDCKLMTVNRQNFNQMVTTQAQLIARLTTMLAERLWSMCRQVSNASLSDPLSKMIDMFALQIEKSKKTFMRGERYFSELTLQDLVNLCGIPDHQKATAMYHFQNYPAVKINDNKLYAPDPAEVIKEAAFRRKQRFK